MGHVREKWQRQVTIGSSRAPVFGNFPAEAGHGGSRKILTTSRHSQCENVGLFVEQHRPFPSCREHPIPGVAIVLASISGV
ncbi:hypothetical protein RB213_004415 [Colletotrichum asianum]